MHARFVVYVTWIFLTTLSTAAFVTFSHARLIRGAGRCHLLHTHARLRPRACATDFTDLTLVRTFCHTTFAVGFVVIVYALVICSRLDTQCTFTLHYLRYHTLPRYACGLPRLHTATPPAGYRVTHARHTTLLLPRVLRCSSFTTVVRSPRTFDYSPRSAFVTRWLIVRYTFRTTICYLRFHVGAVRCSRIRFYVSLRLPRSTTRCVPVTLVTILVVIIFYVDLFVPRVAFTLPVTFRM